MQCRGGVRDVARGADSAGEHAARVIAVDVRTPGRALGGHPRRRHEASKVSGLRRVAAPTQDAHRQRRSVFGLQWILAQATRALRALRREAERIRSCARRRRAGGSHRLEGWKCQGRPGRMPGWPRAGYFDARIRRIPCCRMRALLDCRRWRPATRRRPGAMPEVRPGSCTRTPTRCAAVPGTRWRRPASCRPPAPRRWTAPASSAAPPRTRAG